MAFHVFCMFYSHRRPSYMLGIVEVFAKECSALKHKSCFKYLKNAFFLQLNLICYLLFNNRKTLNTQIQLMTHKDKGEIQI